MATYKGFSRVKLRKPERSKFDLSHEKKLSTRMGKLVPVFISETLPNDTFRVNTEVMLRLAPLLAPIFHRVKVFVHFFFIPYRLLYKDWEKLITNGRLGTETPPEIPRFDMQNCLLAAQSYFDVGSLHDYLGMRPIPDADSGEWASVRISALPAAAYYKVWYDYYRDRNYVEDNELLPFVSGPTLDVGAVGTTYRELLKLRTRCWEHDYFTSALPWTQRGTEVLMPLQGTGTVTYMDTSRVYRTDGAQEDSGGTLKAGDPLNPDNYLYSDDGIVPGTVRIENVDEVEIDASSVSINDLRQAIRLQEWFERNAVAGSRYNESIYAHFARRTSDGRLQRAEYLGGGRVNVQISEVMTTAWSEDGDANSVPPANPTGRGVGYSSRNAFKYNCEEHGMVLGILSVMPTSGYMQGMPRMFMNRNGFLDWPWPSFAHLGEQEVYQYEIFQSRDNGEGITVPNYADVDNNDRIFGYQSRYADWKYIQSTAHGDFRTSLDFWHLDREFATRPALNESFVTFEDALQDRVFAVSEVDTLWCYIYNDASVVRSLPYYGTPMI